jgi:hypothetical protein
VASAIRVISTLRHRWSCKQGIKLPTWFDETEYFNDAEGQKKDISVTFS